MWTSSLIYFVAALVCYTLQKTPVPISMFGAVELPICSYFALMFVGILLKHRELYWLWCLSWKVQTVQKVYIHLVLLRVTCADDVDTILEVSKTIILFQCYCHELKARHLATVWLSYLVHSLCYVMKCVVWMFFASFYLSLTSLTWCSVRFNSRSILFIYHALLLYPILCPRALFKQPQATKRIHLC